jgi:hypothetical protein
VSDITVTPSPSQRIIVQPGGLPGQPGTPAAQEIIGIREGNPPVLAILFWYEFDSLGGTLDLANCRMRVGVAPLANYVCNVTSNGQTLGTWEVLAGQINGVLTLSQVDYAGLADLQVLAPAVQDANLSDTLIIMALES